MPRAKKSAPDSASEGQVLIYQDAALQLQVRLDGETVWLTQAQIADLYQTSKQNVSLHVQRIFAEGELSPGATVKEYLTVRQEGTRNVQRVIEYYNLEVIVAVGYRVRSPRGMQFRQWATTRLSELLVKGFTLDDDRLKQGGGGDYFDELLARIRDIRSSERVFWRKVLDIYALSEDYDPSAEASKRFFQTVQNKMHWAIHGHTAAEIVHERADAAKPHMGLTSWTGAQLRKADVTTAKNYLTPEELQALNLIVAAYLDFAELQATARKPMRMAAWIAKLDDFIRISDRDILTHAGKISHETARLKAESEYEVYRAAQDALPQPVDHHFDNAIQQLTQIEKEAKKSPARKPKKGEKA